MQSIENINRPSRHRIGELRRGEKILEVKACKGLPAGRCNDLIGFCERTEIRLENSYWLCGYYGLTEN